MPVSERDNNFNGQQHCRVIRVDDVFVILLVNEGIKVFTKKLFDRKRLDRSTEYTVPGVPVNSKILDTRLNYKTDNA